MGDMNGEPRVPGIGFDALKRAHPVSEKGGIDQAISLWERFQHAAQDERTAHALDRFGDLYMRTADLEQGADFFTQAAMIFEDLHRYPEAISSMSKVLQIHSRRTEAQLRLARLLARSDRLEDAVEAYMSYARTMLQAGRTDQVVEAWSHIRVLDPVSVRHRVHLAIEMIECGMPAQAADEAMHAAELMVENGRVRAASAWLAYIMRHLPGRIDVPKVIRELQEKHARNIPVPGFNVDKLFGPPLEPHFRTRAGAPGPQGGRPLHPDYGAGTAHG